MKNSPVQTVFAALVLLAGAGLALAEDVKPAPAQAVAPAPAPKPHPKPRKAKTAVSPAALVEINTATKAQLKTLPGISDALADKIIAGRPYYSKAWLNNGVLPPGYYGSLKDKVKCVPPPGLPPKR